MLMALSLLQAVVLGSAVFAADNDKRDFDVPAGDAGETLKCFAQQADREIMFPAESVKVMKTNALKGEFTVPEALDRMLAGTSLRATEDDKTGALAVVRRVPAGGDLPGVAPTDSPTPPQKINMKTNKTLISWIAALFVSVSAGSTNLSAQNTNSAAAAAGQEVVELPKFVITENPLNPYQGQQALSATRVAMPIVDIPQSISVVTSDFIKDSMGFRMQDVAKYVTPINESSLPEGGDRYMIRGFQVSAETIDGSNIGGQSGYNMSLPQFNLDRIEIIKGPNTILVPGGSPGGVMSPITKAPTLKDAVSVTLDLAEYNGNDLGVDINRVLDSKNDMAVRLVATYWRNQRMFLKDQYRIGYEIAPSFSVQLSPTQKLTLKGDIVENREFQLNGIPLDPSVGTTGGYAQIARGLPYNWTFGNDQDSRHRLDYRLSAELLSTLGEHVTSRLYVMVDYVLNENQGGAGGALTASAGGGSRNPSTGCWEPGVNWTTHDNGDGTVTPVSTVVPVTDPSTWIYARNEARQSLHYTEGHAKNDYAAKYDIPWFQSTSTTIGGLTVDFFKFQDMSWAAMAEPSVANNNLNGAIYPTYVWGPILPSVPPNHGSTLGQNTIAKQISLQAFVYETLSAFNDRVLVSGGVSRYYGNLTRTDATLTDLDKNILMLAPSYSMFSNAKSIGLVVKPIKGISLFTSQNSTGGTMPAEPAAGTYLEKTTTYVADSLHPATVTVPAFVPGSGTQFEFGVKTVQLDGTFTATVSHFEIKQKNYGVPNSNAVLAAAEGLPGPLPPSTLYVDLNSTGWEFEFTYALRKNLTILGNYTAYKERQPITNVRIRSVPDHAGAIYLDYRFTNGVLKGFGANMGVDYKGDVAGENQSGYTTTKPIAGIGLVPNQPSFYVAGRTLANLGFSYRARLWTVRMLISNALNKHYIMSASGRAGVYAGEERAVALSTTYNF